MSNRSPEQRLCGLYLAALSAIALTAVIGQVVIQRSLATSLTDGVRVNLAGRQRMLSVDLVRQCLILRDEGLPDVERRICHNRIGEIVDKLQITDHGLRFGNESLELHAATDPAEVDLLTRAQTPLHAMTDAATRMVDNDFDPDRMRKLQSAQAEFLPLMNRAVFRMSGQSRTRIRHSQLVELGLLAFTMLILVGEALFVFKPATDQIRASIAMLRAREKHLRESERRHRDIVRHTAGPIIGLHPDTKRIIDINPAGAEALGEDAVDLVGKRFAVFLDSASAETLGDKIDLLRKDEHAQCQLVLRPRPDGPLGHVAPRWLTRLTVYRRGEDDHRILMTAHDNTDATLREKQLLEQNRRDSLTGLLNRREFDRQIEEMSAAHQNHGTPFTLAMIDIDHFKSINDRYGHQAGDEVLKTLSQLIQKACRHADVVARYGGEEIAVLFPAIDCAAASVIARRIRASLESTELAVESENGVVTLSATASIGMASAPLHAIKPGDIIAAADASLYHAKQSGRNRVEYEIDAVETPIAMAPQPAAECCT